MLIKWFLQLSLGVICANFTNPNNPKVAEDEANYVIQDLEPVADYLSQWIPQLLVSFLLACNLLDKNLTEWNLDGFGGHPDQKRIEPTC